MQDFDASQSATLLHFLTTYENKMLQDTGNGTKILKTRHMQYNTIIKEKEYSKSTVPT